MSPSYDGLQPDGLTSSVMVTVAQTVLTFPSRRVPPKAVLRTRPLSKQHASLSPRTGSRGRYYIYMISIKNEYVSFYSIYVPRVW